MSPLKPENSFEVVLNVKRPTRLTAAASDASSVAVGSIFHRWGIGLVGPLNETAKGNKYIDVATECLSRWPEAKAIPDKSAESIHAFLLGLVYRFGACNVA